MSKALNPAVQIFLCNIEYFMQKTCFEKLNQYIILATIIHLLGKYTAVACLSFSYFNL